MVERHAELGLLPGPRPPIGRVYHRLSEFLEHLEQLEQHVASLDDRVSIAILEEDLTALLEECEEFLYEDLADPRGIRSFRSRSATVLEEARTLVESLGDRLSSPHVS